MSEMWFKFLDEEAVKSGKYKPAGEYPDRQEGLMITIYDREKGRYSEAYEIERVDGKPKIGKCRMKEQGVKNIVDNLWGGMFDE